MMTACARPAPTARALAVHLILPLGIVVVGFDFTALPLLLAQAGVPVDRIVSISSKPKVELCNTGGRWNTRTP
jgi:hypothetical protein